MKLQIKAHDCTLSPTDEIAIRRHVDQLTPELAHFDPDLVHLDLVIRKQARREAFTCDLRLTIMEHVMAARRNTAQEIRTLLNQAFADLREQLAAMNAHLRHEADWERKRGARRDPDLDRTDRELAALRAALDEAMAEGQTSFAVLADTRLPAVRRILYEGLSHDGTPPDQDELDRALMQTLAAAQQDLHGKPESWSLYGWLAWVARRELHRHIRA